LASAAGNNQHARRSALQALTAVLASGESLATALPAAVAGLAEARERAFARELVYGVLRWLPRLDGVLAATLAHPLRPREHAVRAALLLGLYQLLYTRVPAYAAVSETVSLLRASDRAWATGLANAVLRRVDRERDALLARVDADPVTRYAHPAWLIEAIREAWPADWQAVLAANNAHPPLTLRVNARRTTRTAYLETLASQGIAARPAPHAPQGVTLEGALEVEALPGFAAGLCSVQDAAAQLAAPLLDLAPGQRVLDACAAPGGKTAHILEIEPALAEVVALEQAPARVALLTATLERLGLEARVARGDAGDPAGWWDGRPFDRILLDAPCSATGVIRRHPDVKSRRDPAAVAELARGQRRLLAALWPLLAPAGTLLYATCSVLPAENEAVVADFLASHPDAQPEALDCPWGRARGHGRQTLPGDEGMDGFFYARLHRED
jgi:16S rRNA (cytosine967-C5)-methyltransferase